MKRANKFITSLVLILAIMVASSLSVSAARVQGIIGDESNPTAAYDYSFKNPLFPWSCVKGYTNTTFLVDQTTINAGFDAFSYICGTSDDGLASTQKTAYVEKGTNYAQTGEISMNGYTKNCHSTHKSVYFDGNMDFSKILSSSN